MSKNDEVKTMNIELFVKNMVEKGNAAIYIIETCVKEYSVTSDKASEIHLKMVREVKESQPAYQQHGFWKCIRCKTENGRMVGTGRNGSRKHMREWMCLKCLSHSILAIQNSKEFNSDLNK